MGEVDKTGSERPAILCQISVTTQSDDREAGQEFQIIYEGPTANFINAEREKILI